MYIQYKYILSMYIKIHVLVHVCRHKCTSTCMFASTYAHQCTHMNACVHLQYMYTFTQLQIQIHTQWIHKTRIKKHMQTNICTNIILCTRTCTFMYVHIHVCVCNYLYKVYICAPCSLSDSMKITKKCKFDLMYNVHYTHVGQS